MDALVIGPPGGLADAVARGLRRRGLAVLQAIPADVADDERATWLLDEAGRPPRIIVFDTAPYAVVQRLLAHTSSELVLVAERRAAIAQPAAGGERTYVPREEPGLTVVALGRAGRRWFHPGERHRADPLSAERAAAIVIRACGAAVGAPAR